MPSAPLVSSSDLQQTLLPFAFLIPVLATMYGWAVLSYQNDKRERRKEIREHLQAAHEKSDAALASAMEYWCTEQGTKRAAAAARLKWELAAVSKSIATAEKAGLARVGWDKVVDLRFAITGEDFEKKGRRQKAADVDRVSAAAAAADDLFADLDSAYYDQFAIRSPHRWLWVIPLVIVILLLG